MNKKLRVYATHLIALPLVAIISGCPDSNGTATIRYEQLGACNGYVDGTTAVSAGPDAAYVLFKIIDIDNKNGKVNFPYDPTKLFVPSNSHVSTTLSLASKIGVLGTTSTNVSAGTDLPHNGYAVVVVPTTHSSDPQIEANATNYFLSYQTGSGDPGVLLDKKNSSQTTYNGAQNCLSKSW